MKNGARVSKRPNHVENTDFLNREKKDALMREEIHE